MAFHQYSCNIPWQDSEKKFGPLSGSAPKVNGVFLANTDSPTKFCANLPSNPTDKPTTLKNNQWKWDLPGGSNDDDISGNANYWK